MRCHLPTARRWQGAAIILREGTGAALLLASLLTHASPGTCQQVPDTTFRPAQGSPAYSTNEGPLVLIDEGHYNFHTFAGRFSPFAGLLTRDGFRLAASAGPIRPSSLDSVQIMVIANPLSSENTERWTLPTPSAFSLEEIGVLYAWVERGGSLLLIADHMPFGGAAEALAARFGIRFANGFVMDSTHTTGLIRFRQSDRSLGDHPGLSVTASIDSVTTFTGQGFRLERPGTPLLTIPTGWYQFLPKQAWEFLPETPRQPAHGLLQGALLTVGQGRVAVFGEAAMFTAQLAGPAQTPAGFNHPEAPQNAQFVLNVLHWLAAVERR